MVIVKANQSVEIAVALSGTRDNHANFGSSMDDIVVTLGDLVETNHAPVALDDAYSLVRGTELNVAEPGVLTPLLVLNCFIGLTGVNIQ